VTIGAPLRGREQELAEVDRVLGTLADGRGSVLLVEGAAGIGKTRLLDEALLRASAQGAHVASGRAEAIGAAAPLTPLLHALTTGETPIVERAEVRALERPGDQRFWLLEELAELLELRCRITPIVVILDDLHWADDATLWAVGTLARRLLPHPIAWIVAVRPAEVATPAARLLAALSDAGAHRIGLAPLSSAELETVARDVLGGVPDPALRDLLTGAAGNPFLALELVNGLVADNAVSVNDGVALLTGDGAPAQFHERVRLRFGNLTPDTLAFLETAAVFGREFKLDDVAAVRETTPAALVVSVDEALRAEILDDGADRLRFRHDLLREAISSRLSPSNQRALHRAAADAILGRGGPAVEAAAHLMEYSDAGDQAAIGVLQQAAGAVAATAPRAAADLMVRAVELMTPGQPGWLDSVIATVGLLAWATRFTEASDLAMRVLAGRLDPMSDGRVRLGVSDALMLEARRVDLIAQAEESLARPELPESLRAHFLHNLAQGLGQDGQVDAAERAFRDALTLTGEEDVSLALSCRIGLGLMTSFRGHLGEALAEAEANVAACDLAGPEAQQRMPLLAKAAILAALDRFEEATVALEQCKELADRLGTAWALEFAQRIAVANCWYQGHLSDAEAEAEAVLAMAEALDLWHDTDVPLGVLGLVAFHRNDLSGATAQVQRALDSGSRYSQSSPLLRWQFVEALMIDAGGSPVDAIVGLYDVYDRSDALVAALAMDGALAPALVRLALRAGDRVRASRVVGASRTLERANPGSPAHSAGLHHGQGLLDDDASELVRAAEELRDSPRRLARASAFEDAGVAQARADGTGAAAFLTTAYEGYAEIGAHRDEARVRQHLRDAGVRRRPRAAVAPTTTGWDSLTPAELRVVGLVKDGMTNRQIAERLFLSPYTVGTHLKHVFTKLDLSSRAELARLATLQEEAPERAISHPRDAGRGRSPR
jgi:ATP/maltotriose-dependent transcriptional regulator MalT